MHVNRASTALLAFIAAAHPPWLPADDQPQWGEPFSRIASDPAM